MNGRPQPLSPAVSPYQAEGKRNYIEEKIWALTDRIHWFMTCQLSPAYQSMYIFFKIKLINLRKITVSSYKPIFDCLLLLSFQVYYYRTPQFSYCLVSSNLAKPVVLFLPFLLWLLFCILKMRLKTGKYCQRAVGWFKPNPRSKSF